MKRHKITIEYIDDLSDDTTLWGIRPRTKDPLGIENFHRVDERINTTEDITNLACAIETMRRVAVGYRRNFGPSPSRYVALIFKEGTCCGAAVREVPNATETEKRKVRSDVLREARKGDPRALNGATLLVNFELDAEGVRVLREEGAARATFPRKFDVVAAPRINAETRSMLRRRPNCAMFENPNLAKIELLEVRPQKLFQFINGMLLLTTLHISVPHFSDAVMKGAEEGYGFRGKEQRYIHQQNRRNLVLAWAIGSSAQGGSGIAVVGNETLYAHIANATSQMGAVRQVETQLAPKGSVRYKLAAYFNTFFDRADAPTELARLGINFLCVPQGGVERERIGKVLEEKAITVIYLPETVR